MIKAIIRDENRFYSAHVLKTWTWYPRYHNYCWSLEVATLWLGGSEEEQKETFPLLLDYDGEFTVAGFCISTCKLGEQDETDITRNRKVSSLLSR